MSYPTYETTDSGQRLYKFATTLFTQPIANACSHCGGHNIVVVNERAYAEFKRGGKNIQQVFPDLSDEQRELILTGMHPECWDELFKPTDEDDALM